MAIKRGYVFRDSLVLRKALTIYFLTNFSLFSNCINDYSISEATEKSLQLGKANFSFFGLRTRQVIRAGRSAREIYY